MIYPNTCTAKRHIDEHCARQAGLRCLAKYRAEGRADTLYVYKCKRCAGWHLTKHALPAYFAVDYPAAKGGK